MKIAFTGSRNLDASHAPLVSSVVRALIATGASGFTVGCARGADALVREELRRVHAAFVLFSAEEFAGRLRIPYRQALIVRSFAAVDAVRPAGALVAFFSSPSSLGTFKTCTHAAKRGLPVLAFACGFAAASLPSLGAGSWVAAAGALGALGALRWQEVAQQQPLV